MPEAFVGEREHEETEDSPHVPRWTEPPARGRYSVAHKMLRVYGQRKTLLWMAHWARKACKRCPGSFTGSLYRQAVQRGKLSDRQLYYIFQKIHA